MSEYIMTSETRLEPEEDFRIYIGKFFKNLLKNHYDRISQNDRQTSSGSVDSCLFAS